MNCPQCGAAISAGMQFCGECGAPVVPQQPPPIPRPHAAHGDAPSPSRGAPDLPPPLPRHVAPDSVATHVSAWGIVIAVSAVFLLLAFALLAAFLHAVFSPPSRAGGSAALILLLALLMSLFTIVIYVVANWKIAIKAGYAGPLSLLMLIPVAHSVFYLIFAFDEWPIERQLRALRGSATRGSMRSSGSTSAAST